MPTGKKADEMLRLQGMRLDLASYSVGGRYPVF